MPRKTAQPEMFSDEPEFGSGILGLAGQAIAAHPSLAGGTAAFLVIFGFVASNALWNQPGAHPAPFFKTREIAEPALPAETGALQTGTGETARDDSGRTYRIERRDTTPTASIPVPKGRQQAAADAPSSAAATRPAGDPVLMRIQEILTSTGHYAGSVDGLIGPKSRAAIAAWQKQAGLNPTGEPSPALLQVMDGQRPASGGKSAAAAAPAEAKIEAPTPTHRPSAQAQPTIETIAAAPPVTEPVAQTVPAASELVRQIQSGLSNIAYADIAVDGMIGGQTRAAIKAFEKHYRLPVTGEPNTLVLEKLIEIGAL